MDTETVMVQSAVGAWKLAVKRTSSTFDKMSDERFFQEIAPGKNRPVYLLGHLTAVHDAMFPLLGIGERLHPELDTAFVTNPDRFTEHMPSLEALKGYWAEVNGRLLERFEALTPGEWLARHTGMTDDDFVKDPTRNKLSVLLNRAGHCSFHLGQLVLAR
jgi:hypothetical protein